ncbi:MAG TPA: serine/threonine-protein kinase [Blastocatellia bacterium]|nr:serine/threonine-protein kinase [Blastocatellia bacterium]
MIGKVIGNYEIASELAQGGMGAVYRGKHLSLPREVVIKSILHAGLSQGTQDLLKARFLREAYIQSQLDHPNIVRVYEFFTTEENYYLVMEYVAGMSLHDLLRQRGALAPPEAIQLFKQALAGMDYAHNFQYQDETSRSHAGIVHRDIKPANMLLNGQAQLKITDFGIVKVAGEQGLTQSGFNPGTVAYMSPEQLRGMVLDVRSDIYSLGVTLYEMLAGRLPFPSSTPGSDYEIRKGHIELEPPSLTELRPEIPAELNAIVMRSLRKDPDKRLQTVAEFLDAILLYEQGAPGKVVGNPMQEIARQTRLVAGGTNRRPAAQTSEATLPRAAAGPLSRPGAPVRVNVTLEPTSFRVAQQEPSRGRGKMIAGAALILLVIAAAVPFISSRKGSETVSDNNTVPVVQPSATATPTVETSRPAVTVVQQSAPATPAPEAAASAPSPSPAADNSAASASAAGEAELNQAREHENQERYRDAIAVYLNYLRSYPNAANAGVIAEHLRQVKEFHGVLAVAEQEMRQQDYEAAERDYKQAVMLRPDSRLAKAGYEEARTQAQLARRYAPTPAPNNNASQPAQQPMQQPPPMFGPPPGGGRGPMPPPGGGPPPRRP